MTDPPKIMNTKRPTQPPRIPKFTIARGAMASGLFEKKTQAIGEYVGREYGQEMRMLVMQMKETKFTALTLSSKPTKQEELLWGKEYDAYAKKRDRYELDKAKVFATILGQCDEMMKSRLERMNGYDKIDEAADVIALLKMIKNAMYDTSDKKYPAMQAVVAWKQMLRAFQQEEEDLLAYYRRFKGLIERVEATYGDIEPVKAAERDSNYAKDKDKALAATREKMLAYAFMDGAGRAFKPLLKDLEQDYSLGEGKYPTNLEEALQVLTAFEDQHGLNKKRNRLRELADAPELNFAQKIEMIKKQVCFKCNKPGHKAYQCKQTTGPTEADKPASGIGAAQVTKDEDVPSWMD